MADCYVASVRRGDVPCVESVLRTTAERENVQAVERSVAVYERLMTDQLDSTPAESVQAFIAAHDHSEQQAITTFTGLVMFDTDGSSRHQLDVSIILSHFLLFIVPSMFFINHRSIHRASHTRPTTMYIGCSENYCKPTNFAYSLFWRLELC